MRSLLILSCAEIVKLLKPEQAEQFEAALERLDRGSRRAKQPQRRPAVQLEQVSHTRAMLVVPSHPGLLDVPTGQDIRLWRLSPEHIQRPVGGHSELQDFHRVGLATVYLATESLL